MTGRVLGWPALVVLLGALGAGCARSALETAEAQGMGGRPAGRAGFTSDLGIYWSHGTGVGRGPVRLTHAPMDPEDVATIIPMGHMVGDHVTPVDPFDYFDEPLKGRLLALNPRKKPPLGGKIDYDVDGRLVGNWFREGTNGYAGGSDPRGYWMGHLAVAYHHILADRIVVSLGDFGGRMRQFWVAGNAPDPATVGEATGPVKYELVWASVNGMGQPITPPDTGVQGVFLAQVLEGRRLRVETFVGKSAAEVAGFTDASRVYER